MNNANYPVWALECLDFDFRNAHFAKSVDIYYKKDIDCAGKILSEAYLDKETLTTIHSIKNSATNEELCTMKIEWGVI